MSCCRAYNKANDECDNVFNCAPYPVAGSFCIACAKVTPVFLGASAPFFPGSCLFEAAITGCAVTQLPICAICTLNSIKGLIQRGKIKALPSQPKIVEEGT